MRLLLMFVLLVFISQAVYSAELITVDPNTPESKREMVFNQKVDNRLAQKVTCTLGYTRLRYAAEELSKLSGVSIKCGRNSDDWQVRDIPVVIYVKDLTLAKALEGLALATHTQLSISRIDDLVSYRFLRSSTLEKQIAQYEPDRQKAVTDGLKWDWDAAIKFNEMPASDFPMGSDYTNVVYAYAYTPYAAAFARSLGAVLKPLGASIRDRIASGQEFTVSTESQPALSDVLREAARRELDYTDNASLRQNGMPFDRSLVPDIDSNRVSLSIKRKQLSDTTYLELSIKVQDSKESKSSYESIENLGSLVGRVTRYVKLADTAPRPQAPEVPDVKAPEPMFTVLKQSDASEPDLIKTKVTVPKPNVEGTMTAANAVIDMAKTAGVSIICEDFLNHLNFFYTARIYGEERSISDSLRLLNPLPSYGDDPPLGEREWIVDTNSNLVLGRDREWVKRHNNLIPENLVTWFTERLNGKGVVLDNIIPLLNLSSEQKTEWIEFDKDLKPLNGVVRVLGQGPNSDLWKIYAGLNDDYRSMLSSESGLPIRLFDPALMLSVVNNTAKSSDWFKEHLSGGEDELTEPNELKNFSFRLYEQKSDGYIQYVASIMPEPAVNIVVVPKEGKAEGHFEQDPVLIRRLASTIGLHRWVLELRYKNGDLKQTWSAFSPDFPIFSNKRLEELKKDSS